MKKIECFDLNQALKIEHNEQRQAISELTMRCETKGNSASIETWNTLFKQRGLLTFEEIRTALGVLNSHDMFMQELVSWT